MVALGEVASVNPRGEATSGESSVSFVGMAELDAGQGVARPLATRRFAEVAKGYTLFRNRDVLAAKITPCWENGKVGQALLDHPVGVGSTEFHVLRPGVELDDRYLLHFLRQPWVRAAGESRMTGSAGQKRVPANFFRDLEIPLPPLPEQRRIAAILDHSYALRSKRRQVLDRLDALTQSIFHEMFGDPSKNPKQLPLRKLAELGRLDRGVSKHRPRNDPALMGGRFPLIQTGDVARSHGYIREYSSTYSDLGLAQSKVWPAGTLCVTIAANIGKTGILTFDACFPDSVVGFSSDPETVEYVRVWLSLRQAALEASAPQSAQKNINLAVLRALDVPLPDRTSLIGFSNRVSKVRELAETHRRAASKDDELLASLQSRAFDGRL